MCLSEIGAVQHQHLPCVCRLQAMGFKAYFSNTLNRLDFIIVFSSIMSYVLRLFSILMDGKHTAILRVLRMLKFVRAARVARILFRSPAIKELVTKAFRGLDAVFSLVVFIAFILVLSAIIGTSPIKQLLCGCVRERICLCHACLP